MDDLKNSQLAKALERQLAELNHEIDVLTRKRAEMRHRFNKIHAFTSCLTTETLSMIFGYTCDLSAAADIDDEYRPVILGSVSVRWREVAHSTPSLWNRLCIHLRSPAHASMKTFSLLQLYFRNLANQTISLRLDLPYEYYNAKIPVPDAEGLGGDQAIYETEAMVPINNIFRFIIKEHPAKLQRLFIDEFSLDYLSFFIGNIDSSIGLPNLERLHIGWSQGVPAGHDWNSRLIPLPDRLVPRLVHVSLVQTSPGFTIPYGQMTNIYLEYIAIDRCLEIIALCPRISDCHICYPSLPIDWDKEVPTKSVTLSHTICLGWAFGHQKWDAAFLKLFTFPALERFRCEDQGPDETYLEPDLAYVDPDMWLLQRQFLSRCPKLSVYKRAAGDITNWTFPELCDDLPNTVTEIHLWNVEAEEAARVNAKLKRGDDNTMKIFPQLRVLHLHGNFSYSITLLFPALITMLKSRRRALPEQYKNQARLEVLGLKWVPEGETPPQPLTQEQTAQLQELVNEGLEVTTTNSERKDLIWLPQKSYPSQQCSS